MSTLPLPIDLEYPESDGKPVGETDLHVEWFVRLREMLKYRYRNEQVYVAADLLLYYEEGVPRQFVVPDIFVVKDCDPRLRRTYKLWEEGQPPHVAFELTSLSSKREDAVFKPQTYAKIGIREYFLYDPAGEYLSPALQGYRLTDSGHARIEPDATGALICEELDLLLRLQSDGGLGLTDRSTGERLMTRWEAAQRAEAAAERAAAEVERLRRLLDEQSG